MLLPQLLQLLRVWMPSKDSLRAPDVHYTFASPVQSRHMYAYGRFDCRARPNAHSKTSKLAGFGSLAQAHIARMVRASSPLWPLA